MIAAGVSFFYYGTHTFRQSESQSQVQRNIRLAADIITDELRNASDLTVVVVGTELPEGYSAIRLTNSDLIRITPDHPIGSLSIGTISGVTVSFQNVSGKTLLRYRVTSSINGQAYSISNNVLLNNLSAPYLQSRQVRFNEDYTIADTSEAGYFLVYKK